MTPTQTKRTRGFIDLEVIILLSLMMLVGFFGYSLYKKETVRMQNGYAAWVKLTGNPKALTYDEWRSLVNVGGNGDLPMVIPIVTR